MTTRAELLKRIEEGLEGVTEALRDHGHDGFSKQIFQEQFDILARARWSIEAEEALRKLHNETLERKCIWPHVQISELLAKAPKSEES